MEESISIMESKLKDLLQEMSRDISLIESKSKIHMEGENALANETNEKSIHYKPICQATRYSYSSLL